MLGIKTTNKPSQSTFRETKYVRAQLLTFVIFSRNTCPLKSDAYVSRYSLSRMRTHEFAYVYAIEHIRSYISLVLRTTPSGVNPLSRRDSCAKIGERANVGCANSKSNEVRGLCRAYEIEQREEE